MVRRLDALGMALPEQWQPQNAAGVYGRMHMARGLVSAGYAASLQDAFERFLRRGAQAYVSRRKFPSQDLIRAIRSSGGQAVLAHPGRMRLGAAAIERLIRSLASQGLAGIEAFYPTHTGEEAEYFAALARDMSLVCTYGSDYHGSGGAIAQEFERFPIGRQTYEWLEELV
jgi:predicted metal-dependent phosphoesterase TrpH